jgi:TnpA family transposase
VVELDGLPRAAELLEAVRLLRTWNEKRSRKQAELPPTGFVPEKWRPYVSPAPNAVDRHYWELCVLDCLHEALKSGDVWAVGGRRYGNVEDLLIPKGEWQGMRDECYGELGLPRDPKAWLGGILPTLREQIEKTTRGLPENPQALVEGGSVRLRPIEAVPEPDGLRALKAEVSQSWPQVRIQDLLVEVDGWVGFTKIFRTLQGRGRAKEDVGRGLLAALIAKGCNIGMTKMAALAPGIREGTLRRVDELYLYEDTLRQAFRALEEAHRELPMSGWLGDPDVSMSDGLRVTTRVGTLRASLHPHVLGPGKRALTFYYHVLHRGPGYGAQVIGHDRDAAFVLDQIFHIQSELPIHHHYTDTHGATEVTFAIAYPNGVEFAPRIKQVHEQDLYRPPGMEVEGPFALHFAGAVDAELIETYWDDYVRILSSIRRGRTSAVLLSLRLSSYARQNPLYRALREVGRIYKTRFIMRYYDDAPYRRRINAGLARIEHFNELSRVLYFARRGENWEREFEQQLNRASALLFLANACVLWNTVRLSETYKKLREAGLPCDPEDFRHVSPYAHEHIVPYGEYVFRRKPEEGREAFDRARQL